MEGRVERSGVERVGTEGEAVEGEDGVEIPSPSGRFAARRSVGERSAEEVELRADVESGVEEGKGVVVAHRICDEVPHALLGEGCAQGPDAVGGDGAGIEDLHVHGGAVGVARANPGPFGQGTTAGPPSPYGHRARVPRPRGSHSARPVPGASAGSAGCR